MPDFTLCRPREGNKSVPNAHFQSKGTAFRNRYHPARHSITLVFGFQQCDYFARFLIPSLHARRFFGFSPTFFLFTETLRTIGRVSTHPAHSTQCLRATGRAAQCAAPTKPSLLNQRNMYVDHVKRSRQKSSERKLKTPIRRGGTPAISCAVREALAPAVRARFNPRSGIPQRAERPRRYF